MRSRIARIFGERQLARQSDAVDAEPLREGDALGAGDAHLRAAVKLDVGRDLARQRCHARVLHDQRVGAGFGDGGERTHGLVEFVFEDQRVEGDEALDAAGVQGAHHFRQFARAKSRPSPAP